MFIFHGGLIVEEERKKELRATFIEIVKSGVDEAVIRLWLESLPEEEQAYVFEYVDELRNNL